MNFTQKLQKKAEENNFVLNSKQLQQFELFYKMLIEKNKVMNLTSITE